MCMRGICRRYLHPRLCSEVLPSHSVRESFECLAAIAHIARSIEPNDRFRRCRFSATERSKVGRCNSGKRGSIFTKYRSMRLDKRSASGKIKGGIASSRACYHWNVCFVREYRVSAETYRARCPELRPLNPAEDVVMEGNISRISSRIDYRSYELVMTRLSEMPPGIINRKLTKFLRKRFNAVLDILSLFMLRWGIGRS